MKKMFFKNDLELLLEILEMVKTSLEYLDVSENDLRANEETDVLHRRRHFGFINGLKKVYHRSSNDMFLDTWPLKELNLMSTGLV